MPFLHTYKQKHTAFLIFFVMFSGIVMGQTVGLQEYKSGNKSGYVLFSPMLSKSTYLINKCGDTVHTWRRFTKPGASVYFLSNGDLLRTEHVLNTKFNVQSAAGGRIELLDWNDNVLWFYQISDTAQLQHHDIAPMPNGDVLAIVWERKSRSFALNLGRDPAKLDSLIWFTKIVELKPIGLDSAKIVWQWNVWDHVCQDFDPTKPNYDTISKHPELVNINYIYSQKHAASDWLHVNSIDYNPQTDQILLSVHNFSEVWVIDHSTTTAQAASHSGGKYGKGGDILYRWGNPAAYDRGTVSDQQFFGQHDAHWIKQGLPNAGKIIVFNNGLRRPQGKYSSIDIIDPPITDSDTYTPPVNDTTPYLPKKPSWDYTAPNPTDFYSMNIGSAQVLSNGNVLICSGDPGIFFEIDNTKKIVWQYTNPVCFDTAVVQGTVPTGNSVFRCTYIAPDFPGLSGKDLTPGRPIELNPTFPSLCSGISTGVQDIPTKTKFSTFPNPAHNYLNIKINPFQNNLILNIFNFEGKLLFKSKIESSKSTVDLSKYPSGIYLLSIKKDGRELFSNKFIKE